jgi:hypothetical protein
LEEFKNMAVRRMLKHKREQGTRVWREQHYEEIPASEDILGCSNAGGSHRHGLQ